MLDTSITVKTDRFDGPLSLLLFLIQKEEMDIKDLDLTVITRQYLAYLDKMRELNFDIAGEYLFLASTLLWLKSKSCLNEEETIALVDSGEELAIATQADLVARLEELEHFQKMGEKLWELPKKGHDIFVRPKVDKKSIINSILTPMDLGKLTAAMMDLLQKNKRRFTVVRRDKISIKEKLVFLKGFLKKGESSTLEEIVRKDGEYDISNIIVSFISVLELARLKKISIFQNEGERELYVNVVDSLEDFDIDLADGFEDEDETEQIEEDELSEVEDKPASEPLS